MHRILASLILVVWVAFPVFAQDITGDWQGILKAGPQEFHMVLHIAKEEKGGFTGTLDSIENNAFGIPLSSISIQDSNLRFAMDISQAKYEGYVDAAAESIQGTWLQANQSFPMGFKRQTVAWDRSVAGAEQGTFELVSDEREVTFEFSGDTFYGTLLIPENARGKAPGVLLLSGSGPTDRDGNSSLLPGKTESHKNFARILADAGVASLRYDKYGTGKTGLGSYARKLTSLTFDTYVDLALAAYHYLGNRPEIDPERLAILGHSEGGLIALVATDRMKTEIPPVALILAASASKPYMTLLRDQIAAQYESAVKAKAYTRRQADDGMAELDGIIAQVQRDATVPKKISPHFAKLFSPPNLRFLQTAHRYDPRKLAANLPANMGILVLCGSKDSQCPCSSEKLLADAFEQGGHNGMRFVKLANVNHVFKEVEGVPNPATDYTDPAKPFSHEAERVITDFIETTLLP